MKKSIFFILCFLFFISLINADDLLSGEPDLVLPFEVPEGEKVASYHFSTLGESVVYTQVKGTAPWDMVNGTLHVGGQVIENVSDYTFYGFLSDGLSPVLIWSVEGEGDYFLFKDQIIGPYENIRSPKVFDDESGYWLVVKEQGHHLYRNGKIVYSDTASYYWYGLKFSEDNEHFGAIIGDLQSGYSVMIDGEEVYYVESALEDLYFSPDGSRWACSQVIKGFKRQLVVDGELQTDRLFLKLAKAAFSDNNENFACYLVGAFFKGELIENGNVLSNGKFCYSLKYSDEGLQASFKKGSKISFYNSKDGISEKKGKKVAWSGVLADGKEVLLIQKDSNAKRFELYFDGVLQRKLRSKVYLTKIADVVFTPDDRILAIDHTRTFRYEYYTENYNYIQYFPEQFDQAMTVSRADILAKIYHLQGSEIISVKAVDRPPYEFRDDEQAQTWYTERKSYLNGEEIPGYVIRQGGEIPGFTMYDKKAGTFSIYLK